MDEDPSLLRRTARDLRANRPLADLSAKLRGKDARGIVFVHVPKCGGTSVERSLRAKMILGRRLIAPDESYRAAMVLTGHDDTEEYRHRILVRASELRRDLLHQYLAEGAVLVTGHAPLGPHTLDAFGASHDFVTVMRSPSERMLSHVAFNRSPAAGHGRTELTAARFLQTDRAKVLGALYVKYLAGLPMNADLSAQSAIDAAKRTVDRLALVGFTDEMPSFAHQLGQLIGKSVSIGHENRGNEVAMPAGVAEKIEALCAPDVAVYAHARARFADRRSEPRGEE